MRILLFGEFSGLHRNLKDGLNENGHEVVIAAAQDGYKKIRGDIDLDSAMLGVLGKIEVRLKPFYKLPKLRGFDVIQIISPFFPNAKLFPRLFYYSILRRLNQKFFVLGAGSDSYYWRYGRERLKYGPFEDFLKYDVNSNRFYMQSEQAFRYNRNIVEASNGLIPVMYDYEVSYRDCKKRLNTIPLPINTKEVEYRDNKIDNKLVVFHGLSRYGFKGTRHVEAAFDYLSSKYPNDLELVIEGRLPLAEYLEIMRKSNIVIDQVNSYSTGMNGLYAMAMGKVVVGGAEPEGLKSIGVSASPVINSTPNKNHLIEIIESLLSARNEISSMGFKSRAYVEKNHCHIKVAKRYLDTWAEN